jgi:putative peptide maturation system protein
MRINRAGLNDYVALEVNGEQVGLEAVLRQAKFTGRLQFMHDAVDASLIRQAAAERGLEVSDEELQRAADDFRMRHELHDVEATESWLAANHLSYEAWEASLEEQALEHKLRDAMTAQKIEQHFVENRLTFDTATISQLIVKDEGVARELRAQIIEDGADFHALARQFSIDEATKPASGFVGTVRRTEMEAVIEAAVFGAPPGQVVGPFKADAGWTLIKIEASRRGVLDDATREAIKARLFDEWLQEQRRKARIKFSLLEESVDE